MPMFSVGIWSSDNYPVGVAMGDCPFGVAMATILLVWVWQLSFSTGDCNH